MSDSITGIARLYSVVPWLVHVHQTFSLCGVSVRACARACARATHDHRINRAAVMFVWVGEFVVALIS